MEGIKLDTKIQPWDERKRDLEEAEEVERQEQARIAQEAARNRRPQSDIQPPDAKRRRTEMEEGFDPQEGTSSNQSTPISPSSLQHAQKSGLTIPSQWVTPSCLSKYIKSQICGSSCA